MRLPFALCLLLFANPAFSLPSAETFSESLTLDSLPDGKVYARFAFKSVISNVSPRVPETLGGEDEGEPISSQVDGKFAHIMT